MDAPAITPVRLTDAPRWRTFQCRDCGRVVETLGRAASCAGRPGKSHDRTLMILTKEELLEREEQASLDQEPETQPQFPKAEPQAKVSGSLPDDVPGAIVLRRPDVIVSIAQLTAEKRLSKDGGEPVQSVEERGSEKSQSRPSLALDTSPSPRGVNVKSHENALGAAPNGESGVEVVPRGEEPYFVYFLRTIPEIKGDPVFVKIGISARPDERKEEIDRGCCYRTEIAVSYAAPLSAARAIEAALHQHLKANHHYREWFRETPRIRQLINQIRVGRAISLDPPPQTS